MILQTDPDHRSLCHTHVRAARQECHCRGASGSVTGGFAPPGSSHPLPGAGLAQSDTEMHPRGIQGWVIPPQPIPCQGWTQGEAPGRAPCAELSLCSWGCFHPQKSSCQDLECLSPSWGCPSSSSPPKKCTRMARKSHGSAKAGR